MSIPQRRDYGDYCKEQYIICHYLLEKYISGLQVNSKLSKQTEWDVSLEKFISWLEHEIVMILFGVEFQ